MRDKNLRDWCVYKHTNRVNGKIYIGITCIGEGRWGENGTGYLHKINGKYVQPYLARAILKYGWESFDTEILHENLTNEEASEKEKELIIKYDTRNKDKGYNIREGGSHGHLSEDTKRKLREGVGTKYDGEGNPFYGKKHTEEARQKMRESVRKRQETIDKEEERELMTYMSMIGVLSKHGEDPFIYICENTGKRYNTIWEASEDSGCSIQGIKNTCAGHQHTTNTFVWRRILKEEYYYLKDYHNFPENELLKE